MTVKIITPLLWLSWVAISCLNGLFIYKLAAHFIPFKETKWARPILYILFTGSAGMVIWVGDPNLAFTLLVFFPCFLLCTQGELSQRLSLALIFFCYIMAVCAMLDTYLMHVEAYDQLTQLLRPMVFGGLYFLLRKRLPPEPPKLSRRLWRLMLGLGAMPFLSIVAVVALSYNIHDSLLVQSQALRQGLVVLPMVLGSSLLLLLALLTLADYERLQQQERLAALRELYYQNLRREQNQVRTLRHDLRNHLAALQGLLEEGETSKALDYVNQLEDSPAFAGSRRLCQHEAANAVLSAKLEEMEHLGLIADMQIALPEQLSISDVDLCALLGNALDNAMEAAVKAPDKRITLRCRVEKGMLMLKATNALTGEETAELRSTKADSAHHGFGLPGMREIAGRYGGSLEAGPREGRFELLACLPVTAPGG